MKKFVIWDIENIKYQSLKNYFTLFKVEFSHKLIVCNNTYLPLKENQKNGLIHDNWKFNFVNHGKDSADFKIISILEENLNKYDEFHVITGDKGFSGTLSLILKKSKNLSLYCNIDKSEKLINSLYRSLSDKELSFLKIINL